LPAYKTLDAKVKLFTKENKAKPKHKSSIESGNMQKLNRYFMEWNKLVEFIWFWLCFHFSRGGRVEWRKLTRHSFEIKLMTLEAITLSKTC